MATSIKYELLIAFRDDVVSLTACSVKSLLTQAQKKMGDDLSISTMSLGVEGGGILIKRVTLWELEKLAEANVKVGSSNTCIQE